MEHSKLPWKKKHHKILDFHGRLVADVRGACGFQEDEGNAELIYKACNEHDNLKAKEKLLDDFVTFLDSASGKITEDEASIEVLAKVVELAENVKALK